MSNGSQHPEACSSPVRLARAEPLSCSNGMVLRAYRKQGGNLAGARRTPSPPSPHPVLEPENRRRARVLDLDPGFHAPRPIGCIAPFRHDALEAELAGVREDYRAVALEVLADADA